MDWVETIQSSPIFLQTRLRHESRDKYVIHISKTAFQKNDMLKRRITMWAMYTMIESVHSMTELMMSGTTATKTVWPATADDESWTGMTATQTDPATTEDDMSDPVTDNIAKLTADKRVSENGPSHEPIRAVSQEFDTVKREFSTGQVSRQLAVFDQTIKVPTTMIQSVAETLKAWTHYAY